MANFSGLKLAGPILAVVFAGGLTQGCGSEDDASASCGAELGVKIDSLNASVDALQAVAADMQADLSIACSGLAGDEDPDDSLSEDDLKHKCAGAAGVIEAAFDAGLTLE